MSITVPKVFQNINGALTPVPLVPQTVSYTTNGFTVDTTQTQFPLQVGVPIQGKYFWHFIPCTATSASVAQAQTVTANVPLTLVTAPQADPNPGANPYMTVPFTFGGKQCVLYDCERIPSLTLSVDLTADTTITLEGFDYRGTALISQDTLPDGTVAGAYVIGNKPFSLLSSVTFSTSPAGTVSIGASNYFGLPYFLSQSAFITFANWDNTNFTDIADLQLTGGNTWRSIAPSPTSGSARGVIELPVGQEANNNAIFVMEYFVMGADSEHNNMLQNLYPSALTFSDVQKNASGQYTWPYNVTYDEIGMQYPGDNAAYQAYTQALAI